jgi:hypothetical protein
MLLSNSFFKNLLDAPTHHPQGPTEYCEVHTQSPAGFAFGDSVILGENKKPSGSQAGGRSAEVGRYDEEEEEEDLNRKPLSRRSATRLTRQAVPREP